MTTLEVFCARCQNTRWIPSPYIPLDGRGKQIGPPQNLTTDYTCVRCRRVLAGKRATDPLVLATPERRTQLQAARRFVSPSSSQSSQAGSHAGADTQVRTRGTSTS